MPKFEFCLPTLGKTVPSGPEWFYEIKYDGLYEASRVKKFSRKNIFSRGSRRVSAVLH
jgi:bifunctional non-homologous end joining protein LigD